MIGWIGLGLSVLSVVLWWGREPYALWWVSLIALGVSFWTFCMLYEAPMNRARGRIAGRLAQISNKGADFEEFQKLSSMTPRATAADRKFVWNPMSTINVAACIVAGALVAWRAVNLVM